MDVTMCLSKSSVADIVHKILHLKIVYINSISVLFVLLLSLERAITFKGL